MEPTLVPPRKRRDWLLRVGAGIVAVVTALALFGPWIGPYDPTLTTPRVAVPPAGLSDYAAWGRGELDHRPHLMGTDASGYDVFSRVIAAPRTVTPRRSFEAELYVLKKEAGGRHTPFFTGYSPQFFFRTRDQAGIVTLHDGIDMVMPGDNVKVTVKLNDPVAIDESLRFAIREGGRTVGSGVVTKVLA